MTTRRLQIALVITLAAALAACGGKPSEPTGNAPTAQATAVAAAPSATPAPTAAAPTAAQAEDQSLSDLAQGLDKLKSYSLKFTISFEGTENGAAKKGALEYTQEYIAASRNQRFRVASQGDWTQGGAAEAGSVEMLSIDGMSYMYTPDQTGDQQCMGFSSSDQNQGPVLDAFKPESIIGGIEKAKLVGRGEDVNGIKTDHYTISDGGIGLAGSSDVKGDAWIASDGGYLVKYQGTAKGKGMFLGPNAEGAYTWAYDLTQINQLSEIALPEACANQKAATDIPIPANATEKMILGKMQTFKTVDAPKAVASFYSKELKAQGWTAGEGTSVEGMEMLVFTKDGRKLTITITLEGSGSSVMISEESGA
jgi:hypothetical protein